MLKQRFECLQEKKKKRVTYIYVNFFFALSKERGRQCKRNNACNSFSRLLFRLPNTIVLILHCYRFGRVRRKYLTSLPFTLCVFSHRCIPYSLSLFLSLFFPFICINHDDNELKNNNNNSSSKYIHHRTNIIRFYTRIIKRRSSVFITFSYS